MLRVTVLSIFLTSVHALPVPGDPALDGGPLRRGLHHERVEVVQHLGKHTWSGNGDNLINIHFKMRTICDNLIHNHLWVG